MGIVLNEFSEVIDQADAYERLKKEKEYLDYIKEHIKNVEFSFNNYFMPLLLKNNISSIISDTDLKDAINMVASRIKNHDASKFSDDEFYGYRMKWYPTTYELSLDDEYTKDLEEKYEKCWEHHYIMNSHHPMHWYDSKNKVARPMSLDAIIEMICDWNAMGIFYGTSTLDWYKNDAAEEKSIMHSDTLRLVEELMYNVVYK